MTELQQELHAKVSKPAESAEELAKVEEAEKDLDRISRISKHSQNPTENSVGFFLTWKCQILLTFCCPPVILKM